MRTAACLFGATLAVLLAGCGGNVEVTDTGGAAGGGATSSSNGGGGSSVTGGTGGTTSTSTTETVSTTTTVDDGCPDAPGDVFWVEVQVGDETVHLDGACPYMNQPYGPDAYAMTNGKSGPEWYFVISACKAVIPEGDVKGPSIQIVAQIPENAMVTVPYDTKGDVTYITEGQDALDPVMFPTIVFNQFGPEHTLVSGKLSGTVTWTDGQTVTINGQFSVCRRSNVIFI